MDTNPYQSPEADSHSPPAKKHSTTKFGSRKLRFCLVVIVGSIGQFAAWCIADFVLVRFFPAYINSFDWLFLFMPIVVPLGGAMVLRDVEVGLRFALSLGATLLASILGIALILFLGIPFHFWIGGTL